MKSLSLNWRIDSISSSVLIRSPASIGWNSSNTWSVCSTCDRSYSLSTLSSRARVAVMPITEAKVGGAITPS